MNNHIQVIKANETGIFSNYIYKAIPLAFDESMSYYETLCGLLDYLKNTIIPTVNNNADAVIELQNNVDAFEQSVTNQINTFETNMTQAFNQLQSFVDNYFDNLDVQQEINNKLDAMVEDGTLPSIIETYLNTIALFTYSTVNSMKQATNLTNGSYAKTMGYHTANDGGSANYIIKTKTNEDIPNDMTIIQLNDENLVAELVYTNYLNTKQLGFIADGTTDESSKMTTLNSILKDGLTIKVEGIILTNHFTFTGSSTLTNVTFTGSDSTIGYGTVETLTNGFKIIKEENYTKTHALEFNGFNGLTIKNLIIETNETVTNGALPLNGLYGIKLTNSPYTLIDGCSIKYCFIGIYATSSSNILKIKNNNISLCNVGIWISGIGDSIIEDNYINTLGWNIYKDDNYTLKDEYTTLNSNGMVHGKAIYIAGGGAIDITGGKIEYCNAGLYIDGSKNLDISNIVFDRCNHYGIGFDSTSYKWTKSNNNISNCNFIGCGNNVSSDANLDGACISIKRINAINIGNCSFKSANQTYQDQFPSSDKFYGPKEAFIKVNYSRFINVGNCTFNDNKYTIIPVNSIVNVSNIASLQANTYSNTTGIISTPFGYKKNILLSGNSNNLTFGCFELGDKLSKAYTAVSYLSCTGEGSLGSITGQKGSVLQGTITDGDLSFTANKEYILLDNYNGDNYGEGDYIEIDGVTGYKKIIQIIYVPSSNKYYARLNTACDVAVSDADLSLHAPTIS